MKTFMMIFRFEPNFSSQPTPEDLEKQKQAWGSWIGTIASSGKMVDTNRFSFEGKTVNINGYIVNQYYAPDNKMISGYMTVKSENIAEVTSLAKECPIHLLGGFTEVREIIPM